MTSTYYVDIASSDNQIWEVKPRKMGNSLSGVDGYDQNAGRQLNKYQSINPELIRGSILDDIEAVPILTVGEITLTMNIDFFDSGKILYDFNLTDGSNTTSLTTSQAEDFVEYNFDYPLTDDILDVITDFLEKSGKRR